LKRIFFILIIFLLSCTPNTQIIQKIEVKGIDSSMWTVTTYFSYPYGYNSSVDCKLFQIDSIKHFEREEAKRIQKIMLNKNK